MIQRKQTLYLLLALIITVICLCLPVATLVPQGMGVDMPMYNLWVVDIISGWLTLMGGTSLVCGYCSLSCS